MAVKRKFSFKLSEFVLIICLLSSGVLLAFSSGGFVLNLKNVGFSIFSTMEVGVHRCLNGFTGVFTSVYKLRQLRKDYEELEVKLANYEQMQRANADIKKENERLREQLDFVTSLEEKNYPAVIISRDSDNIFPSFTIDKGSSSGIKKNMPVIAFQDGNSGLVGKVVQVGLFTSQVMPIYNLNCTISARIQNTRDLGLVTGQGSDLTSLKMTYIRKRALDELHYGDVVVTSGENNNYMRDLPIGFISKISVIDYNSSLDIELSPIINFSKLEYVTVVNMKEINDARK